MATPSKGGVYLPDRDYTRTGATDTGGTYASPTITSPAITGTTTIGAGATITSPTITGATISAGASIVSPVVTGDAGTGTIFAKTVLFTEDATSTIHTGTVVIPAGAILLDIIVTPQVLWTDSSAVFTCGDANSANGWFTSCNLNATDLILGERLRAADSLSWGGVNGAYLVAATGRFGQQSTNMISGFCPTVYSVIGVVTVTTPSGTAGRTRMTVLWLVGQTVAPVLT